MNAKFLALAGLAFGATFCCAFEKIAYIDSFDYPGCFET